MKDWGNDKIQNKLNSTLAESKVNKVLPGVEDDKRERAEGEVFSRLAGILEALLLLMAEKPAWFIVCRADGATASVQ